MTEEMVKVSTDGAIAEKRAENIHENIARLNVDSIDSYLHMGGLLKRVKQLVDIFETETRPEIDQAYKLHKALIARRDKWADKFAEAEALGKDKLKRFLEVADPPKIEGIVVGETWDGEVIDAAQIPREYLTPDIKKLKDITKVLKEATVIPGWKAKSGKTISVRS